MLFEQKQTPAVSRKGEFLLLRAAAKRRHKLTMPRPSLYAAAAIALTA